MNFSKLNPYVYDVNLYEKVSRNEVCRAYEAKLIYLLSGELTYTLDKGKKSRLSVGNLLYIPAGVPYSFKTKYMRAVIVRFDLTDAFCEKVRLMPATEEEFLCELCHREDIPHFDKPILLEDIEGERDTFIRMSNIFTSAEGNYLAELSAMLKLILLKLAEHTDDNALPSSMVENLDNYIRENLSDEISNTELGAIFGYHPFYISKMLKDKKGITLHQYVIAYRIKFAKKLLECTDKPIADIADELGFTDASYFTKLFKAQFGITPKQYRNEFDKNFI